KIITSAPFTLLNDREGETQTIDIHLQPADYRITPGHQIQLVVDTKDRFFGDATVTNSKIEISSTDGSSSYLNIPLDEIPLEND
ncbi:CocE/NonD family hydrolase C-terminal non-catalytic domain-containing protein, partial [Frankia casuarinae]